ncbi:MAG TPA: hypothetical protein VIA62_22195 [Thermoanaerobaculia bacterium]|jgi:hypothetical protein|nr:hypothetical protein [Thermoanaerobaculia bacterium]
MSHERTVEQFVREVEHITGVRIRLRWYPICGLTLQDTETLNEYSLGSIHKKTVLSPYVQESICRGLYREHWQVLLGLRPPVED